eukprot:COSAG05_NODE_5918_length_1059_cov_3.848958_2_plen_27_part_01
MLKFVLVVMTSINGAPRFNGLFENVQE